MEAKVGGRFPAAVDIAFKPPIILEHVGAFSSEIRTMWTSQNHMFLFDYANMRIGCLLN